MSGPSEVRDRWTGKMRPRIPLDVHESREACDGCGKREIVYDCPQCGAPNCCPTCCAEAREEAQ